MRNHSNSLQVRSIGTGALERGATRFNESRGLETISRRSEDIAWDFSAEYERLEATYLRTNRPVVVNFRKLVPLHSGIDRSTHLIHSYPAKLLVNIPLFFLNTVQLRKTTGTVLDPFCGTGTVLVEAMLSGRKAVGADANPLARLIAQVKTTRLDSDSVLEACDAILACHRSVQPVRFTPVVDPDKWFDSTTQRHLGLLLRAIRDQTRGPVRRFMEVCFSACVRKVSHADPRLSVPVVLRNDSRECGPGDRPQLSKLFQSAVASNLTRIERLQTIDQSILDSLQITDDARAIPSPPSALGQAVDLIITSPPYGGAQKYIRACSLSIGWLGLAPNDKLRNLERRVIGREHFEKKEYETLHLPDVYGARPILQKIWTMNPLRAHIAAIYLREMKDALSCASEQLSKGGHLVLVIGDNNVCGALFPNSRFFRSILDALGLNLKLALIDDIRSRGLMTKRNKTAGIISQERIYVFQK